jgi:hypothetical protein
LARRLSVAGALLLLLALAPGAGATAATATELSQLAERARTDPTALERLRRVDRVDGRPYAIEDALAGARGPELDRRLEEIASTAPARGRPPDAARARESAGEIVSGSRYEGSDLPRPLEGLFDRVGDLIDPVRDWFENAFDDLASVTPGGDVTVWTITAALLLALMLTLGTRALRHRAEVGAEARIAAARPERETPASLEHAADRAEREGDLETALRLRFRAGLLRLDAREAIAFRPSISTREVSRALNSPEFDRLAALFDGVVYGGAEATPEAVASSRRAWEAVLREASR